MEMRRISSHARTHTHERITTDQTSRQRQHPTIPSRLIPRPQPYDDTTPDDDDRLQPKPCTQTTSSHMTYTLHLLRASQVPNSATNVNENIFSQEQLQRENNRKKITSHFENFRPRPLFEVFPVQIKSTDHSLSPPLGAVGYSDGSSNRSVKQPVSLFWREIHNPGTLFCCWVGSCMALAQAVPCRRWFARTEELDHAVAENWIDRQIMSFQDSSLGPCLTSVGLSLKESGTGWRFMIQRPKLHPVTSSTAFDRLPLRLPIRSHHRLSRCRRPQHTRHW